MLVSLIVPVFNAVDTIDRCVESVLNQSFQDWELLLINDGSKDNSFEILKNYEEKYPGKIRALTQENQGVTKTRERGVLEANGEYIMFVDNDDYLDEDYIETFVTTAQREGADVVLGGYRRITKDKKILMSMYPKSHWMQYSVMTPWTRIIKKSLLIEKDIHFLDYKIGEDLYFNMQLYSKAENLVRIDYIGYNWFYNENSVNNTVHKGMKNVYDPLYLLDRVDEVIDHKRDKEHCYWYVNWVIWYLFFSGKDATKQEFLKESDRLINWLQNKGIPFRFPLVSSVIEGESIRNRLVFNGFIFIHKIGLLPLFATFYCKG